MSAEANSLSTPVTTGWRRIRVRVGGLSQSKDILWSIGVAVIWYRRSKGLVLTIVSDTSPCEEGLHRLHPSARGARRGREGACLSSVVVIWRRVSPAVAIGSFLDLERLEGEAHHMIALTTATATTNKTALTLRAFALKPVSDALWALHACPEDRSASIVAALLHKEGVDRCPCCAHWCAAATNKLMAHRGSEQLSP